MKKIEKSAKQRIIAGVLVVLIVVVVIVGGYLMVGRAGLMRFKKNFDSKMGDGITRELTIYDSSGNEILSRMGKFDFIYDGNHIEYIDTKTKLKYNIFAGEHTVVVINETVELKNGK